MRFFLLICLCCLQCISLFAQDQKIVDSLIIIYNQGDLEGEDKLQLLVDLSFNESQNSDLALKFANELIQLSKEQADNKFLANGYIQKGNINKRLGNLEVAITNFFKGAETAKNGKHLNSEGVAYLSIADVYSIMGNSKNAELYYDKSIEILRKTNDSVSLATSLLNAGDEYFNTKDYELALEYFQESGAIFKKTNYLIGTAYNLGNVGMVYAEQGKNTLAELNINRAIAILEELQDYYPVSVYLTYMADIYARKNDMPSAFDYAQRSLDLATKYQLKNQVSDAYLKLSELYEKDGNDSKSLLFYKNHITYRDSVKNIEGLQNMANLRTDFEVSKKQIEVDLLEQKKKTQNVILYATIGVLFLIGLLALGLLRRNKYIKSMNNIIEEEKARSDKLLLNILPVETAEELKKYGKVKAKKFESVTVLFSDFENFTKYSEHLSPELLVETVDFYFSEFDKIIAKYNLEKIKTIGDAYMCAGGLQHSPSNHAKSVVQAAFEIAAFVDKIKNEVDKENLNFNVRLGINSGPVVAGVVGSSKFAYDIWGDTVNIASRMESNSGIGKINVSEKTYRLIKDEFKCEYRGEIDVKNKGKMKMYFVNSKE